MAVFKSIWTSVWQLEFEQGWVGNQAFKQWQGLVVSEDTYHHASSQAYTPFGHGK